MRRHKKTTNDEVTSAFLGRVGRSFGSSGPVPPLTAGQIFHLMTGFRNTFQYLKKTDDFRQKLFRLPMMLSKSRLENNFASVSRRITSSTLGNGYALFRVTAFRRLKSIQNLISDFIFTNTTGKLQGQSECTTVPSSYIDLTCFCMILRSAKNTRCDLTWTGDFLFHFCVQRYSSHL